MNGKGIFKLFFLFFLLIITFFSFDCSRQPSPPPEPDAGIVDGGSQDGGADGGWQKIGFGTISSGGKRLKSADYTLDLFTAPAEPSGSGHSADYKIKLGPGGPDTTRH